MYDPTAIVHTTNGNISSESKSERVEDEGDEDGCIVDFCSESRL
jgi:hypothetical protein